jgi:glycosyltransferase involved in cell wall biosynthesis
MHILITVKNRIPSLYYGGTERVVWYLAKELVSLGHKVTFLAPEGSVSDFCNVLIYDTAKSLDDQIPDYVDIVHVNEDFFSEELKKPTVVTVHGNPENYDGLHQNSIFVSQNHAKRYQSECFVHNGLDWDDYPKFTNSNKRHSFHFLGKAAWNVKNVRGAINIIINTRKESLKVLGGTRWHPNTFSLNPRIKYLGMVDNVKKAEVMNASKGLVFPVLWDEPFGLAITESLYYGCPVFGTPYGSLPELITSDVGFLSSSLPEITSAVIDSEKYSATTCHDYAVEFFGSKRMALSYLDKYETVLNGNNLNISSPKLAQKPQSKLWVQ